jgi:hypothetical protein
MNNNSIVPLSAYRLLVVNPKGYMRELFCPFRVQCVKPVDTIPAGTWLFVDKLATSTKARLLYRINGIWYAFESFAIVIHF